MTRYVVGADEVGYGALAGPLVVCAVAYPEGLVIRDLKDSKAYNYRSARERAFLEVDAHIVHQEVESADPELIDHYGVYTTLLSAHRTAIQKVVASVDGEITRIVADGNLRLGKGIESIPRADTVVPAVMAASVIAKVLRDRLMVSLSEKYPGYEFEKNMGYGSKRHLEAIHKFGLCAIHRKSYRIKRLDP